jgi:hypothetical protein
MVDKSYVNNESKYDIGLEGDDNDNNTITILTF